MASKKQKKNSATRTSNRAQGDQTARGNGGNGRAEEAVDQQLQIPAAEDLKHEDLGFDDDQVIEMYRNMMLQRRFEERAAQMYGRQKISGFLHLYIGQEAISTATAFVLRKEDYTITAYRDHGLGLALGMSPDECMAELFGKIDGCSRGKGGSMHFFSSKLNFLGGHGIVAGQIPVGVGVSFACKYKETDNVCLTFFGDGAINQGAFHEAANLAALYKLPAVLICENNMYGMGTSVARASAITDLSKRSVAYGMHGDVVNGMDVFAVIKALQKYVALARKGEPSLLDIRTYRYRGHSASDPAKYRTKEELEAKKNEDPIFRLKSYILEREITDDEALEKIDDEIKDEVRESVEFADNSPEPPLETIYEDIYVQKDYPFIV